MSKELTKIINQKCQDCGKQFSTIVEIKAKREDLD